jgi:hypothetical protein
MCLREISLPPCAFSECCLNESFATFLLSSDRESMFFCSVKCVFTFRTLVRSSTFLCSLLKSLVSLSIIVGESGSCEYDKRAVVSQSDIFFFFFFSVHQIMEGDFPVIAASKRSHAAINFIRQIVDRIKLPPADPSKPLIPLSIGDPTLFGNLPPPSGVSEEFARVLASGKANGYLNAMGATDARVAIAKSLSTLANPVVGDEVCVTSGCSHALMIAVEVLCDAGSNILIPAPGFSLYRTLARYLDVEAKEYRLDPEKNWEIDLAHLESLITHKVLLCFVLCFVFLYM